MAGEDFVQVQMSAAGIAFAGKDSVITVQNGRSDFRFKAGSALRVVKGYEWAFLAQQRIAGQPLFELVSATPPVPTPTPTPTPTPSKPAA